MYFDLLNNFLTLSLELRSYYHSFLKLLFQNLNIIKECGKIIYCPYEAEFEKLIDLSIFETENFNNFTNLINNIYEWSNLTLMNLIFEQENVIKLFSSIKKVFFMESGDFYNSFINSASKLLNKEIIKDNIPFKMI